MDASKPARKVALLSKCKHNSRSGKHACGKITHNRNYNSDGNHHRQNSATEHMGGCGKGTVTVGRSSQGLYDHKLNKSVDRCADSQCHQDCDRSIAIRIRRLTGRNESGLKSHVHKDDQQHGIQPRVCVMRLGNHRHRTSVS